MKKMRGNINSSSDNMSTIEEESSELRRGPWTLEEDTLLTHYVSRHGEGRWNMLAKSAGLKRTGKSCRLRWLNYLKPDIKRGNLTPQEQLLILELHSKWGNRWSKIAQCLPGRTDNEIKNYWRTRVQKQARQLNIESNSKSFIDAARCFWMPRLLQKMEQNSSSSSSSSSTSPLPNNINDNNSQSPNTNYPTTFSPSPLVSSTSNLNGNYPGDFSLDFTEISKQPQHQTKAILNETQINRPNEYENGCYSNYYNPILPGDSCYDIEGLNFNYVPDGTSTAMEMDHYYNAYPFSSGFHVAEGDWTTSDMGDALWNNMDDIWQLRE